MKRKPKSKKTEADTMEVFEHGMVKKSIIGQVLKLWLKGVSDKEICKTAGVPDELYKRIVFQYLFQAFAGKQWENGKWV